MFGNLVSSAFKIATLPLDAVNAGLDIATGGDGSKESRTEIPVLGDLEQIRDRVAEAAQDADE